MRVDILEFAQMCWTQDYDKRQRVLNQEQFAALMQRLTPWGRPLWTDTYTGSL